MREGVKREGRRIEEEVSGRGGREWRWGQPATNERSSSSPLLCVYSS